LDFSFDENIAVVNFNCRVKRDFFIFFNNIYNEIMDKNIILLFDNKKKITNSFLDKLIDISAKHQRLQLSFVIVSSLLNSELVPQSLTWSPTLKEAKNIIEMDIMQRDLGL